MIRSLSILFCLHRGRLRNSTDSPAPEPEPVDEGLCSSDSDCSDGEVCDPYLNEGQEDGSLHRRPIRLRGFKGQDVPPGCRFRGPCGMYSRRSVHGV